MKFTHSSQLATLPLRIWMGIVLVVTGEALLVAAHRPFSDFYFPLVWLGLILLLDGAIYLQTRTSLFTRLPRHAVALFGLSVGFWWLFEGFNVALGSWHYHGAGRYTGLGYVIFASIDFSLVLAAVWEAATVVWFLLPRAVGSPGNNVPLPRWLLPLSATAGIASFALPIALPHVFYGLIWVSLFFVLDPINAWMGRPSLWVAVWSRHWRLPLSFALGALMCGFFWESWNEWATPKWTYSIPYVGFWHIFQMPLLGWFGYLPFGLELFAMTNFVLPLLRMAPLSLEAVIGIGVVVPEPQVRESQPAPRRSRSGIHVPSHAGEVRREDSESVRAT